MCMQAAWLTDQDTDVDDAAAARGHKSQKTASGARYTPHQDAAQPSTFRQATAQQPATMSWYQHRAGSLGAEGTGHVQDPPMSDAEQPQAAATQPAGPKITLKLKRRWSAGSEDYDDSWFAQHVDRQPVRKGPVSSLHEVSSPYIFTLCCIVHWWQAEVQSPNHEAPSAVFASGLWQAIGRLYWIGFSH